MRQEEQPLVISKSYDGTPYTLKGVCTVWIGGKVGDDIKFLPIDIIKANVPSRIGLRTTDSTNSSIVIDEPGLEKLKGYGDSIVVLKDGTQERVQGPFITNDEIIATFDYLKEEFGTPEFFDYKQKAVDLGLVQWAEEYDEDTPWNEKHVKKPKKSLFG